MTMDGQTMDTGVIGILLAHLRAFGSSQLEMLIDDGPTDGWRD